MKLKGDDEIISMDILPAVIVANIATASEQEEEITESEELNPEVGTSGPWLLAITSGGYGKRVPVTLFRLQNRAGFGTIAMKFRSSSDQLVAVRIVNAEEELMIVTSRGIIIRQVVDAISLQSRTAMGVRVQRLDEDDAIAAVALVPPSETEEEEE
jgi:DNA gyrase subunit A